MKYIKLFESNDTEYYHECYGDEWREKVIISMSEKIVNIIADFFNRNPNSIVSYTGDSSHRSGRKIFISLTYSIGLYFLDRIFSPPDILRDTMGKLNIYYSNDDWFYVCYTSRKSTYYYKCDQIDGLRRFLKDKKMIKKNK